MWLGLTGPPRIGGQTFGDQAVVEARGVDESVYHEGRAGAEVLLEERVRVVGRVVWAGLTEARAVELQVALGLVSTVEVRTPAAGDPAWAVGLAVEVRRTSDVELSAPLRPYDARTGRPVATVEFAFRSLRTYTVAELLPALP